MYNYMYIIMSKITHVYVPVFTVKKAGTGIHVYII